MSATSGPASLPPPPGVGPGAPGAAPATPAGSRGGLQAGRAGAPGQSFADVLAGVSAGQQAQPSGELRFSRHALQRVQRRGISLDPSTLSRLQEGVGRAAGKGSRDSVVLVDGAAFVVSVTNRTVLTAVPQEHMREQVFTNIDSAVIA